MRKQILKIYPVKLNFYFTGAFLLLAIFFMLPNFAKAACTGAYPTVIAVCEQTGDITSTVPISIPGGHYATPYIADTANTEYILDGDITADGTAISIQASKVVINLNGHTITYNQTVPGEGVNVSVFNKSDIAITNGMIIQHASYDTLMPSTTLVNDITTSQTSFDVADATGFQIGWTIIVKGSSFGNDEAMTITGIAGNTLSVTRAMLSTAAKVHVTGHVVYMTKSEGDVHGEGNNPIRTAPYLVPRTQVTNIVALYGGRDVSGFILKGTTPLVENNTLIDLFDVGTLKNRQAGTAAIMVPSGQYGIIRGNTVVNARHGGIRPQSYSRVHDNDISVQSIGTNSNGVWVDWGAHDVEVDSNTITASGEHPIGIAAKGPGTKNINIHHNIIDVQTTRLGDEYGGDASCWEPATACGNYAAGFRHTEDANHPDVTNIQFHDNVVTVHTNSAYAGTYSPTGEVIVVNGKGRGVMVGNESTTGSAYITGNTITMLDEDGTGIGHGLSCTAMHNAGSVLVFEDNTVTADLNNVALGDAYGYCDGHPLFIQNTFIKAGDYPAYSTIASGLGGYGKGTGIFISNTYQSGAAENDLNMYFEALTNQGSDKTKSIIFGRLMKATVKDSNSMAAPNINLTVKNNSGITEETRASDVEGAAQFMVYDYELNNAGGTTGSATPIRTDFRPHTIELATLFVTAPDNTAGAWDALSSSGLHTLNDASGSIEINTDGGEYVPPTNDTVAPSAPSGLSVM